MDKLNANLILTLQNVYVQGFFSEIDKFDKFENAVTNLKLK